MGPFWLQIILRHLILRGYQNGTPILETAQIGRRDFRGPPTEREEERETERERENKETVLEKRKSMNSPVMKIATDEDLE